MTLPVVNCSKWDAGACRLGLAGGRPSAGRCGRCQVREALTDGSALTGETITEPDVAPQPITALPRPQWPRWASWLAERRDGADAGVGDVLERLLGQGGVAFKAMWSATFGKLGIDCGCARRRATYNALYPLP